MTARRDRLRSAAARWLRELGWRLGRWSRRLEPGHERARKDERLARALLTMAAIKGLSDDELAAEVWRLCDDLPVGSRPSELLLEVLARLERYRALTVEHVPRPQGPRAP